MVNPFLDAALEYLTLGYCPIPCVPREKRPLVPWKEHQTTTTTPEQVQTWWRQTPDANVALVLGRGRFAVDLDGGEAAEALLAAEGIALPPDAPRSRTGGGFHVFLSSFNAIPDRVGLLTTNGQKPQVDIRGIGIVVVPPSIHPTGARYEWLRALVDNPPRAPMPLLDLIGRAKDAPSAASRDPKAAGNRFWVADALRGVGEGQRDVICTRLAGFLLTKGLDPETTIAILSESFARACVPLFPLRDVEKCVYSIARRQATNADPDRVVHPRSMEDVLDEFSRALAAGPAPTLPTPFPTLNHYLNGGFGPGELVFLGARPGVGKTALGLEIARHAAQRRIGGVLVVSREMTNLALARRLVAQDARIRATALKRAELSEQDRWNLEQSLARLRTLPMYWVDDAVSLTDILSLIDAIANEAPLSLVVVDYLQLIRAPNEIKERRHQVEAVSQGLKGAAMQHKVPLLVLSSLSRASNDEKNRPPTLASLRESGELEHDADIILLLHRAYKDEATTLIVAKNRDGWTGNADLRFRREYVSFDEATDQPDALPGMD